MLSHLDRILFPDRCEVIEVIPSQRYVYPIFKNGWTSLQHAVVQNNWKIKLNNQITAINNIDVIIREPHSRTISGLNTYVQHTLRDNPGLDPDTILWFATNYLYLNRHYCPQFLWLINLTKYLSLDAKLNFLGMELIQHFTTAHLIPPGIKLPTQEFIKKIEDLSCHDMYQRIDIAIFNCIGQSLTFSELLQHIKITDPAAYEYVIEHAQQILKPTYALS